MDRDELIRRFIDNELDGEQRSALLRRAEGDLELSNALVRAQMLRDDVSRLRTLDVKPPAQDQLQRIMQRAVARRQQQESSPWRFFRTLWLPRYRLSLGGLLLVSLGAASLAFGVVTWSQARVVTRTVADVVPPAVVNETAPGTPVPVRFILPAAGASSVSVVGDFNAWQTDVTRLDDEDGDGVFVTTLLLPRGSYSYMFVIDGERWTTDPHATNYRDDGFGQRNAVIRVN